MRYDIPTMLALRQKGYIDPGKLSSGALDDVMFRQRKDKRRVLSERSTNSSQPDPKPDCKVKTAVSSTSNQAIQPRRQPSNPQNGLSQSDAGFARFLKEHSSPKHQRVTAGGRIVPMDAAPVPKLKLPKRRVAGRSGASPAEGKKRLEHLPGDGLLHGLPVAGVTSPGLMMDPTKPPMRGFKAENRRSQESSTHWDAPSIPLPSPQTVPRSDQLLQAGQKFFEYFSMAPGTAYGRGVDQASWSSGTSVLRNASNQGPASALESTHAHSSTASSSTAYPRLLTPFSFAPACLSPGFAETAEQPAHGWGPVVYSYNDLTSGDPASQPQSVSADDLQDAIKTHKSLSVELSQLDRYMAVHTWDIDATLKKALVERRVQLVRDLDAARIRKEQLESSAHLVQRARFDSHHPLWVPSQLPQCQLMGGIDGHGANLPWSPEVLAACGILPFSASRPVDSHVPTLPAMQPFSATLESPSVTSPIFQGMIFDPSTAVLNDQCAGVEAQWCQNWTANPGLVEDVAHADFACPRMETARSLPELQRIYEAIADANCRGEPIGHLLQELASITTRRAQSNAASSKESQRPPSQAETASAREQPPPSRVSHEVTLSQPTTGSSTEINRVQEADSEVQLRRPVLNTHVKGRSEGFDSGSPRRVRRQVCSLAWPGAGRARGPGRADTADDEGWSTDSSSSGSWSIRDGAQARPQDHITAEIERSSRPHDPQSGGHRPKNTPYSSMKSATSTRKHEAKLRKLGLTSCSILHKAVPLAVPLTINAHAFLPRFDGADDTPAPSQGFSKPDSDEYFASERSALVGRGAPEKSTTGTPAQWLVKTERTRPSPSIISAFFRRIRKEEEAMIQKYNAAAASTEG